MKIRLIYVIKLIKADVAKDFKQNLKYNCRLPNFSYHNQKKLT